MRKNDILKLIIVSFLCVVMPACSFGRNGNNDDNEDDVIMNDEDANAAVLAVTDVDTLNPVYTQSVSVANAMQLVFEPLFTFDSSFNAIPVLAESCIGGEDVLNYTIRIKDNILWHDGTMLTADDVVHTFNAIRYNETKYSDMLKNVETVTATDKNTVQIRLMRPTTNFVSLLCFPIIQNSDFADNSSEYIPIGTGPYKYAEKSASNRIKLAANEKWHGEKPAMPVIYLNILKDNNDFINSFNSGEADSITSTVMNLKENAVKGEVNEESYVSNKLTFLGLNNERSVLSGAATRKAIAYITDKQELVTSELFSRAEACDIPINPTAWYYPDVVDEVKDAAYISGLLNSDGWSQDEDGKYCRIKEFFDEETQESYSDTEYLKISILINEENGERKGIATRIADRLNAYGIETEVKEVTLMQYRERIGDKDYSCFIGEVIMSPNMDLHSLIYSYDNYFGYHSDEMNDLIYRIDIASTDEALKAVYVEFADKFISDMPFVPLFFRKESVYFEKIISGVTEPCIFSTYPNPENWYIAQK